MLVSVHWGTLRKDTESCLLVQTKEYLLIIYSSEMDKVRYYMFWAKNLHISIIGKV